MTISAEQTTLQAHRRSRQHSNAGRKQTLVRDHVQPTDGMLDTSLSPPASLARGAQPAPQRRIRPSTRHDVWTALDELRWTGHFDSRRREGGEVARRDLEAGSFFSHQIHQRATGLVQRFGNAAAFGLKLLQADRLQAHLDLARGAFLVANPNDPIKLGCGRQARIDEFEPAHQRGTLHISAGDFHRNSQLHGLHVLKAGRCARTCRTPLRAIPPEQVRRPRQVRQTDATRQIRLGS